VRAPLDSSSWPFGGVNLRCAMLEC
jgi:hypothetical protein